VLSIIAPISNKIKMCIEHPRKNIELAQYPEFKAFIYALCEQILPLWCRKNMKEAKDINDMHNLFFLFSLKI
jgi:hypothetical protein